MSQFSGPGHEANRQPHGDTSPTFFDKPKEYRLVAKGIQHVEARALLERHSFRGDECIVDIGAGDGSFTQGELLSKGQSVIGVDISKEMVASLLDMASELNNRRVWATQGDVSEFSGSWVSDVIEKSLEYGGVDVIYSNATLHHIYSREGLINALNNCRVLLTDELRTRSYPGVMLLSFAGQGNYQELIDAAETAREELGLGKYFNGWEGYPLLRPGVSEFRDIARSANINPDDCLVELVEICTPFNTEDELRSFCKLCLRSYMNQVKETAKSLGETPEQIDILLDSFATKIAENYLKKMPLLDDGTIPLVSTNLEVKITMASQKNESSGIAAIEPHSPVSGFTMGKSLGDRSEDQLIKFLDRVSTMKEVQAYKPLVDSLLGIEPGMRILDAGAGVGSDSLRFAKSTGTSGQVVALDRNQYRLDVLKARAINEGFANIETLREDIRNFSSQGEFDRVYVERTLIHCEDPAKAVEQLVRALKPGGRIVLVEPDFTKLHFASDNPELTRRIVELRAREIQNPDMGALLKRIGQDCKLTDLSAKSITLNHPYQDSRLLDLNDLVELASRPARLTELPVSRVELQSWLQEQELRSTEGNFRASTPMHIVLGSISH